MIMSDTTVSTERLTKYYGRARGVSDLNLDIKPGEIFGFLGPNGAGKTTTIRILLDLIRPSSGSASVFGMDAQQQTVAIRKRIGYLPGEFAMYNDLTGSQLLQYFGALRGGVDQTIVAALAERLGSDLGRRISELSHGNKQKIGLIQALMNRPELLILDEPTTGLDPLVQQEFYRMLEEVRDDGKTVFFSSHVLPEVERVCDRVAIIREGRLIAVEDVSAIKAKAARKIEVTFETPPPADSFTNLPVRDLVLNDRRLQCTVQGSVDSVIKALARFNVVDLVSHEPSLEDTFLALYGDDDKC
ncbi:MAG: ABC transporter ATP-binding protein [Candidatus Krumholzibacteria bacterium]